MGPAVIPTQPWNTPTPGVCGTASAAPSTSPAAAPSDRIEATALPSAAASPSAASPSPSPPPLDPNSLAAHGGAVAYWIDHDGALRRMDALLTKDISVRVDLNRDDRPDLNAAAVLGGAQISPRALTSAEAKGLAQMRQRDLYARGGRVTLSMPAAGGRLITGTGWLDWRTGKIYLLTQDSDDKKDAILFRAAADGIGNRAAKGVTSLPLPMPTGKWASTRWTDLGRTTPVTDLDLLFNEALSLAATGRDDSKSFAKGARRLRADVIGKTKAGVFEIPGPTDAGAPTGYARMPFLGTFSWITCPGKVASGTLSMKTCQGPFRRRR